MLHGGRDLVMKAVPPWSSLGLGDTDVEAYDANVGPACAEASGKSG